MMRFIKNTGIVEITTFTRFPKRLSYNLGQSAFDGTFVQFLHCHLSFVRLQPRKLAFRKILHVLVGKFCERFK